MATPVNLTFPKEEFEGRLSALKDRMRARGLDVLLVFTPENIYPTFPISPLQGLPQSATELPDVAE